MLFAADEFNTAARPDTLLGEVGDENAFGLGLGRERRRRRCSSGRKPTRTRAARGATGGR
nr:hypothetical protein [Jiangella alkaliphila]